MASVFKIDPKSDEQPLDAKAAHARMLERIREVKSDPAKYQELRERLKGKTDDEERAEILVEFITDNEDLLTSLPEGEDERIKAASTITITTVFIFASPAR